MESLQKHTKHNMPFRIYSELREKEETTPGVPLDWLANNVERIHEVIVRQSPSSPSSTFMLFNLYDPKPGKHGKANVWVFSQQYVYSVNFTQDVPIELIGAYLRVLLKNIRGVEVDWFGVRSYTYNNPTFPPLSYPTNIVIDNDIENRPKEGDVVLGGSKN